MKKQAALLFQVSVALVCVAAPALAGSAVVTPEPSYLAVVGGGVGAMILFARWKRPRK